MIAGDDADIVEDTVRAVLRDVLGLSQTRVDALDAQSPLFGAMPELDSMAVAGLLTEIEDRLGIIVEDDEVEPGLGREFLTDDVRRELSQYDEYELLSNDVRFVLRPRSSPSH